MLCGLTNRTETSNFKPQTSPTQQKSPFLAIKNHVYNPLNHSSLSLSLSLSEFFSRKGIKFLGIGFIMVYI